MWKDWIRPFVRPLPQWSPIAVADPSRAVIATLNWGGRSADVTSDHTVASLNPLMIATSVDAGERPVLEYRDSAAGRRLGVLRLRRTATASVDAASIGLYEVEAGDHACLGWPVRRWNAWLQQRSMARHGASAHLNMAPAEAQQLMVAYLYPRPVVLVSVSAPGHRNIFPMDLIGPLERSGLFSLALRSTNVSEPVMREVGRVALSHMPASMKSVVYRLSAHHRQAPQAWGELPFPVRPSREFGIPVAAAALRVQDLEIVRCQTIGLHTFFLARVLADEVLAEGGQLHHTAGFHQAYRRRRRVPFEEA